MTDNEVPSAATTPTVVVVRGTVTFRERIALPPGAVVTVAIEDVSRADAPALVLAKTAIEVKGQVPVPFSLTVDSAEVDARARYSIRTKLRSEVGTWMSDTHNPVLTRGDGETVEVMVRRVPGA
jgi:putative lipoprotein